MEYSIVDFLSQTSRNKLKSFSWNNDKISTPDLAEFLENIYSAFKKHLEIKSIVPTKIEYIRQLFLDFDENFNHAKNSKLSQDLYNMDFVYSLAIKINNDTILTNIICHNKKDNLIPAIIHAIHTFAHAFPFNYDGLQIFICLDDNKRQIGKKTNSDTSVFNYLQKNSAAFTVSAVTKRMDRIIMTTKSEDVIKLLFHEMVHFIGLDHELLAVKPGNFGLNITRQDLNLSEAYTEFMSILINSAYHAIHASYILQVSFHEIFAKMLDIDIKYSVYLSANILRFYGYGYHNFVYFFQKNSVSQDTPNFSPIPIWEYVIIRTQLLLNLSELTNIMDNDWRVNKDNLKQVVDLMKINENFIDKLEYVLRNTEICDNISYTIIDFNWNSLPVIE